MPVDRLVDRLVDRVVDRLVDRLVDRVVDRLAFYYCHKSVANLNIETKQNIFEITFKIFTS